MPGERQAQFVPPTGPDGTQRPHWAEENHSDLEKVRGSMEKQDQDLVQVFHGSSFYSSNQISNLLKHKCGHNSFH